MINRLTRLCLAVGSSLALGSACADGLEEAHRLLEVSNTGSHFETIARRQTRDIIRSYTIIVSNSVDVTLPARVREELAQCYDRVYAWTNFRAGIARILANTLTEKQMRLLIDFYRSRGLPPGEIDTFKATIAMADEIEQVSVEYIYSISASCVERDTRLILSFLHAHPDLVPLSAGDSD